MKSNLFKILAFVCIGIIFGLLFGGIMMYKSGKEWKREVESYIANYHQNIKYPKVLLFSESCITLSINTNRLRA